MLTLRRTAVASAAAVAAIGILAPVASAAAPISKAAQGHSWRHGVVPLRPGKGHNASTGAVTSSNNLTYQGGTGGIGVTDGTPKVYIVFWGSQWGTQGTNSAGNVTLSGDPSGMAPYVEAFLKAVGTGGETWSGVMTQYCQGVAVGTQNCPTGNTQHVGYPSSGAFAGVWVDESTAAPSQATAHQLGQEAVNAATHFGDFSTNSQYVIVSPTGTFPDGFNTPGGQFCAWHDYTGDSTMDGGGAVNSPNGPVAFTNLPYITDMGASCGQGFVNNPGTLDGVSIVEGHEYAETLTDTFPAGGYIDSSGNEDGDKCAWISPPQTGYSRDVNFGGTSYAVQSTWGNDTASCQISHSIVTNGGGANTVTVTNPGTQTGTVGTAVSLQVSASDSASGQTLTYSASGLPAGLSINSSTGLISGTPTTSGTSNVTVKATDTTGANGSASFSWTVNPSGGGGGCTSSQLLGNPGFETGSAAPWTATAGVISNSSAGEPAHSGSWDAWLDGYNSAHTDTLAQTVSIPSPCTHSTFSFWLHIDTRETTSSARDTLKVQVLNSSGTVLATLATFSNLNHNTGYAQHTYNVGSYAGQTVTVKFTGVQVSRTTTSFVIDDTALNTA